MDVAHLNEDQRDDLHQLAHEASKGWSEPVRLETMAAVAQLSSNGVSTLDNLRAILLNARVPSDHRTLACYVAGRLREARLGDAVLQAFETAGDSGVIWEAAKALIAIAPADVAQRFNLVLQADRRVDRRAAAAWALGTVGDRQSADALAGVLRTKDDPSDVRAHAAEALGAMRSEQASPLLIDCLSDDSPDVRYWAAYAVGEIKETAALDALHRMANEDAAVTRSGLAVADEARQAISLIERHADWGRRD